MSYILNFLFSLSKLQPGTRRRATRLSLWCLTHRRRGDDWGTHGCANGRSGRTLEVPRMVYRYPKSCPGNTLLPKKKMEYTSIKELGMDVLIKPGWVFKLQICDFQAFWPPKGEVEFDGFWSVGHINLKVFRPIPQNITCGSFPGHLAEVWGGKISEL